eukprot:567674-Rhodomonas_salina.1
MAPTRLKADSPSVLLRQSTGLTRRLCCAPGYIDPSPAYGASAALYSREPSGRLLYLPNAGCFMSATNMLYLSAACPSGVDSSLGGPGLPERRPRRR